MSLKCVNIQFTAETGSARSVEVPGVAVGHRTCGQAWVERLSAEGVLDSEGTVLWLTGVPTNGEQGHNCIAPEVGSLRTPDVSSVSGKA